jgi:hypothetical protein
MCDLLVGPFFQWIRLFLQEFLCQNQAVVNAIKRYQ